MGRKLELPFLPQRIISLVPSQTELLYDLGLGDRVVGITKFCVHPRKWLKEKTIVGGTKNFRFDQIDALKPDLIIGNKEENYQEGIETLADKYPIWMSDIVTVQDALDMITAVSEICGETEKGVAMAHDISKGLDNISRTTTGKTLYFIWNKPYMAAGPGTFIHQVMSMAGFENAITEERYPEISDQRLEELNPAYVLLSSEPYPFKQKHVAEVKELLPEAKVELVDGEMFSWYGSRLLKLPAYLENLMKSIKG